MTDYVLSVKRLCARLNLRDTAVTSPDNTKWAKLRQHDDISRNISVRNIGDDTGESLVDIDIDKVEKVNQDDNDDHLLTSDTCTIRIKVSDLSSRPNTCSNTVNSDTPNDDVALLKRQNLSKQPKEDADLNEKTCNSSYSDLNRKLSKQRGRSHFDADLGGTCKDRLNSQTFGRHDTSHDTSGKFDDAINDEAAKERYTDAKYGRYQQTQRLDKSINSLNRYNGLVTKGVYSKCAMFEQQVAAPRRLVKHSINDRDQSSIHPFQERRINVNIRHDDVGLHDVIFRDKLKGGVSRKKRNLVVSQSLPVSTTAVSAEKESRRLGNLKMAVDSIHADLMTLQKTDQDVAKLLLSMYHDIRLLKVKSKCVLHQELLFDAMDDADDQDQMPDMCDAPKKSMNKLLLNHGVTWLNINARRFSCS